MGMGFNFEDIDWVYGFLEVSLEKHLITVISNWNSDNAAGRSLFENEIHMHLRDYVLMWNESVSSIVLGLEWIGLGTFITVLIFGLPLSGCLDEEVTISLLPHRKNCGNSFWSYAKVLHHWYSLKQGLLTCRDLHNHKCVEANLVKS